MMHTTVMDQSYQRCMVKVIEST